MNRISYTAFIVLTAAGVTTAHAQVSAPAATSPRPTVETAKDPTGCLDAVNYAYRDRVMERVRAKIDKDSAIMAADIAFRREMATICAARFTVSNLDTAQLQSMAQLLLHAQQFDRMAEALQQRIVMAPPDEKVKTMAAVLSYYVSQFASDTLAKRFPQTMELMRRIDTLDDTPDVRSRLSAYGSMFLFAPEVEKQRMVDSALTILRRMTPAERKSARRSIELLYSEQAKIALRQGREAEIPALVEEGTAMLREAFEKPDVKSDLAETMAFIGKHAPELKVDYWLTSGPDSGKVHDYRNTITIIQTTTTWCGFCKLGYPILKRIASRFQGAVQPVLLTYLEGNQFDTPMPNVADELAAMRKYWVGDVGINFPIYAINPATTGDTTAAANARRGGNHPVFVGIGGVGLPKYVIVDGAGIIRYIQYGHTPSLERDLLAVIHRLQPQLSLSR